MSAGRRAVRHTVRNGGSTVNVSMPKIHAIAGTFRRTLALIVIACVGVALAVGVASPAGAATQTRVTKGEAEAVFQSLFTAGFFVIGNTPAAPHAAPLADEQKPVIMSPISSGPDEPFCVLDWHVIRVGLGSNVLSDLVGSNVRIWLDGAELALTSTAIKPVVGIPPGNYWRAFGIVVPPGTPTAGPHTLRAVEHFGDGHDESDQTSINVGSPDSPQCTGS
jgi:hypothetical protein